MNFKERKDVKAEVSFTGGDPFIYITPIALDKMAWYVQGCDKEIGWLGRVEREDNIFLIHDVYLFKQEVHATTCEISPEGLTDFITELFTKDPENAMNIANNLRLWGHSHVNMAVSPSGQDDTQVNTFKDSNPWFIRVIANKAGEMEFSLYDFEQGIKFKNVKWVEYRQNQVSLEEAIKAEIKEKVTVKPYTTNVSPNSGKSWSYKEGKWVEDVKKEEVKKNTEVVVYLDKEKEYGNPRRTSWIDDENDELYYDNYENLYGKYSETYSAPVRGKNGELTIDFIEENFTIAELAEIATCTTITQASHLIDNIDAKNIFSSLDVMNILDYAQNQYPS